MDALLLTLAIVMPILIPLCLVSFYLNIKSLELLRQQQRLTKEVQTLKRGSRKLFIIHPTKDK